MAFSASFRTCCKAQTNREGREHTERDTLRCTLQSEHDSLIRLRIQDGHKVTTSCGLGTVMYDLCNGRSHASVNSVRYCSPQCDFRHCLRHASQDLSANLNSKAKVVLQNLRSSSTYFQKQLPSSFDPTSTSNTPAVRLVSSRSRGHTLQDSVYSKGNLKKVDCCTGRKLVLISLHLSSVQS